MGPTPALGSLLDGRQPSTLALPPTNLRSRAHCASQYCSLGQSRLARGTQRRGGSTYTGAVLGAGLVGRVLGHATILVHGHKVEGRVEAALDGREVDVKGELVVHEGEHLVLARAVHEVEARANVGAVLVLGDELEGQGVAAGRGTVGGGVVGALHLALGRAVGRGAAHVRLPLVAVVAVVALAVVQPAPVGVDDDLGVDGRARGAARTRALLPGDLGVRLSCRGADRLGGGKAHKQGRGHEERLHGGGGWQTAAARTTKTSEGRERGGVGTRVARRES